MNHTLESIAESLKSIDRSLVGINGNVGAICSELVDEKGMKLSGLIWMLENIKYKLSEISEAYSTPMDVRLVGKPHVCPDKLK
jgi:hypothetical protein